MRDAPAGLTQDQRDPAGENWLQAAELASARTHVPLRKDVRWRPGGDLEPKARKRSEDRFSGMVTSTRDDLRDPIVPGELPLSRDNHAECTMIACFESRRFRSTVPYYGRYRVPYPAPLISFVHERCGLRAGSRVLDLGCGCGAQVRLWHFADIDVLPEDVCSWG